ncbi:MAG: preprotein translocase subunit YajC [Nitrospirae bacterium CG_4_10_14_0_8_um_filter_41_23]|nr:preprotein translocase subunit YajC [Nitrospirota bacterium]OIP59328.1 MAG: preprotein translocase subunit YajC [Nitrospirae bacterium CG2_30_41_42]PIQ93216.1 MAG: preprotein translocase subunit YajC [Nitrospirae bacterium CG11_big_fil_rev_8_21_14_0_20_41_14]PIV41734.1 MAG: preprotein translocase subunit YajC [Nitrospirae bacterium CG02_land_8_20_14_3_00_41_53]PIW86372.1 MAG: preprotein translocase subunit YajC [Nitrospirae bacterium CG_4_8_14_3_um_filter_41_47]PIY87660.1 MAG: preprotein tr
MLIDIIDIAHAMGPGQQGGAGQGAGGMFTSFIPFILIFVIFYFLLIRPQQKRSKEHKKMIEGLKKGDKVITSGGVYGIIEAVGTNTVTLKIAENVKVKFGKAYIAALRPPSEGD